MPLPRAVIAFVVALWAVVSAAQGSGALIFPLGSTSFSSSHASTIVELKDGTLMSAWFGGSREGGHDVAIWSARQTGDGWTVPVELAREPKMPCWNPVLFHTHDGRLWLYYKFGPSPDTWAAARKFSSDEGRTWSAPEHLPAGLLGPIRAKPLVLEDGTIVAGTSLESHGSWTIFLERSTDDARTWTKIGPIRLAVKVKRNPLALARNHGMIQPSVIELGKGHLRLYARSTEDIARICVADSFDNGSTWTAAHTLDVPNPNSGIDAVALRDGRVVLIYNNSTSDRTPLDLAISHDGEHFTNFKTLEDAPGEYSYPAIIQNSKGDLEITYTWNRKSIKYVRVALEDVPR